MSEEKALQVIEETKYIEAWGDEQMISKLAKRLKQTVPALTNLKKPENIVRVAQYAALSGANIFRGEIYAYEDWKGDLQLVEGYKILVRWARRQCNFYEKYAAFTDDERKVHNLGDKAIGYTCYILREDAVPTMKALTEAGVPDAYETVASTAVGIVDEKDMYVQGGKNRGKYIDPPRGWSWDQVARKRALKNALNIAYGMPSPREIAQEGLIVEGVETRMEDWQDVTAKSQPGREAAAVAEATAREVGDSVSDLTDEEREAWIKERNYILHGDPDEDPFARKEEEPIDADVKIVPDDDLLEVLDELSTTLAQMVDEEEVEIKGRTAYLVQKLYEAVGLGTPKWKELSISDVQGVIKNNVQMPDAETGEEPEEKPEEESAEDETPEEETEGNEDAEPEEEDENEDEE